jgi:hypothetical protein
LMPGADYTAIKLTIVRINKPLQTKGEDYLVAISQPKVAFLRRRSLIGNDPALAEAGKTQLECSVLRHAKFSSVALDFVLKQWQLIASASGAPASTT